MDRDDFLKAVSGNAGKFARAVFTSSPRPVGAHKGTDLRKMTTAVIRTGIEYANIHTVKDGVESGERGPVQSLPWGEWAVYPYIVGHRGGEYARLYTVKGAKPTTVYYVDGREVERDEFLTYLPPSAAKSAPVECFTVKMENLISIG